MTVTYSYAPAVQDIAEKLITRHHTHLCDNGYVRIEYLFRSEAQETNGRTVWGKARKVSSVNAFLALPKDDACTDIEDAPEVEPFFVIEIAADVWGTLNGKQRIALVDHELSHCRVKHNQQGEVVLFCAPHDVEEFETVVRRHGLYRSDVQHFAKVASDALSEQLSMMGDEEPQAETPKGRRTRRTEQ